MSADEIRRLAIPKPSEENDKRNTEEGAGDGK